MGAYKLTYTQQRQWAIDGYLLLKGILSEKSVAYLVRQVDRLYRNHVSRNPADKTMHRFNVLPDSTIFIDLIDHDAIFKPVVELMGPYIQLSMAEAHLRPYDPKYRGFIHTDGGQALRHIRVSETSWPLQIKVQYFLTDVKTPYTGNFTVFPGSHLRPFPDDESSVTATTPGAVQLYAEAGDAAIFPHSLWHGVSSNRSKRSRKTLIYCYNQMCFRTFDFNGHSSDLLDHCTPRQRRLLGDLGADWKPGSYFYSPKDQAKIMGG